MSKEQKYIAGDPWSDCPRCGFTYRSSSMKLEYTGLTVCRRCYETMHPQELVYLDTEDIIEGGCGGDWGREQFIRDINEEVLTEIPDGTFTGTDLLLLEDGFYILQEDGTSRIILE